MEIGQLAQLVSPVHEILQHISASEVQQIGIFPERLTLTFQVAREREQKFIGAIKRILELDETFDSGSPLCVFVSRSAQLLPNSTIDWSEWLVQFQVNQREGYNPKIVENQVNAILFELESYLFD